MRISLELKALVWAVMVALSSLGGVALLAVGIQALSASTGATGSMSLAQVSGPVASPDLIEQGHRFYDLSCSHCHGDDATGDEGPSLHHLSLSNARIARTIKYGIKGEMPTFAKKYDDQQVAALVSYLRTLR